MSEAIATIPTSDESEPGLSSLPLEELRKLAARGRQSLFFFAKGILGYEWLNARIHGPICKLLEDPTKTDVAIVLPRGWQKSTLVSICFPLWLAINNPDIRILLTQNTATNAVAKLQVIRHTVEHNEVFRTLYPEVLPTKDSVWREGSLELTRPTKRPESTFEAVGVGGDITGRHYDVAILDDTVAPDVSDMDSVHATPSKEAIEIAIGYHNAMTSILIDIRVSRRIVVGTRWAERDLISHLKATFGDTMVFHERAVRETNGVADPKGEITFPERFPEDVLQKLERSWGPYMYSCLYMNQPIRSEDMVFQPEWFEEYLSEPLRLQVFTSVDIANDPEDLTGADPDYTVVITTGKDPVSGLVYVLDYERKRCNPSEQVDMILLQVKRWGPIKVILPKVGYEQSLKYWTTERMRATNTWFEIELYKYSTASKHQRILGLQPVFASRSVRVRSWMAELKSEMLAFPYGSHDDIPDALAMQLDHWKLTTGKDALARGIRQIDPLEAMADEFLKEKEKVKANDPFEVYATIGFDGLNASLGDLEF